MSDYLWIFVGGGLGSMSRFGLGSWINKFVGDGFPYATLSSNLLSSIILGALIAMLAIHPQGNNNLKLLIGVGFCGAFSTFSTFTLENFELLQAGNAPTALLYTAISVLLCLLGLWIGYSLCKIF